MTLTPKRAIQLQAKLNHIFVEKRDAGASTAAIYAQLKRIEGWLCDRHIFW